MSNYIGKVFSSSPSSILVAVNAGVMGTVPADTRTRPVMSTEPNGMVSTELIKSQGN